MRVLLDAPPLVPPGGRAILRVTSINDEAQQVAWPARLHPNESTISFLVDGVRHQGAEQVDSIVDTIMLGPGQAISTGVLAQVSDRGDVLASSGEVMLQLAIVRPGSSEEVLSNSVMISIADVHAAADAAQLALTDVHAAAVALRDGDVTDNSALAAVFDGIASQDRPWVATALLPAAPMRDDPLLLVATQSTDDDRDDALGTFILDAAPYRYPSITE